MCHSVFTVTGRPLSSSYQYGPIMPLRPMAHHTVTFSTLSGLSTCSWGWAWAQNRMLFVNLSAKVKVFFITKENQVQKVRMVFNLPTDTLTKCKPLCLICSSLSLQNLYFVQKHVKVLVHYTHNGCPGQISFLRQTSCEFPWGHCQMFYHTVDVGVSPSRPLSSTVTFILILNTSSFPKFIQEAQNSDSGWSISAREIATKLSSYVCMSDLVAK